jgi:hypothetical protein
MGARARATARATPKPRPRDQIKRIVEEALRREFPTDTVDVSDGYKDNIHVLVVSRKFDALDERQQGEMLWSIIDATDLTADEKGLLSLVLAVSPSLLK